MVKKSKMSKHDKIAKLKEYVKNFVIKELEKDEELEEVSTTATAGIDGTGTGHYDTPHAFSSGSAVGHKSPEVGGYKKVNEAITGSNRKELLKIGKEIKDNLFRINPGLKKVKDNRLLIRGLANTFMFMRYTPDNANYQNYKKYFPKNFKSSSVQKLANILQKEKDTVRATFFKQVVKENESKKESVFAVRQDKIKNGERFPKEPNFDYDPEKGKSRIRKVNEGSAVIDTETIKVVKFTRVKANSPLHKHLKDITKKVGANVKKIHGGYIVNTDNDMKKLSAVIDYVKKKMKKSKVNEGSLDFAVRS